VINLEKQSQVERISNAGKMPYYEVLALLAANTKWMDMSWISREQLILNIQEHNENTLNQTWRYFEVVCPSRADMEAFLDLSLAKGLFYPLLPRLMRRNTKQSSGRLWRRRNSA
jgi:hypothetical protein